ncbi:MAG: hypothetical protein JWM80_6493 [Cyanobacteria bacterium RYN_339]|nr:hypothetical protein [Cyanobacteria bacterium RYN_339]
MRRLAWLAVFPLLMAVTAAPEGRCTWVGDVAHLGVGPDTITLIGVEARDAGPCAAPGLVFLRQLALDKPVRVERDVEARDPAGGMLAYVYLADGTLLNERVIAAGYARVGPMGANQAHAGELVAAQLAARSERLCLWSGERKQPGKPEVVRGIRPLGGGGGGPRPILPPPQLPPLPNPRGPR